MAGRTAFPLIARLSSTTSAARFPLPLFGSFLGTMQASDFPPAFMTDVRLLAFSVRPSPPSGEGTCGISRFPRKEFPHVHRVFDGAGPVDSSRIALSSVLPSASLNSVGVLDIYISPLNGWPVRTPVNASPLTLRLTAHDSGPVWCATPSP